MSSRGAAPGPEPGPDARRLLAVVLPQLLCELALRPHAASRPSTPFVAADRALLKGKELRARAELPRAIVLVDAVNGELDARAELDAVNSTAHQLGIRPHQMLAHARASVESLVVQPLLRSEVRGTLAHLSEVLLRFGSPVSFRAPGTIWVDITGSCHLHASEQELALEVLAQIRAMGHVARVAVAPGPWLARAFAQHLPPSELGTLHVTAARAARLVDELPIIALPIQPEAVTWFAKLGLLCIGDLKKLPSSAFAARLEGQVTDGSVGDVLELLQGRDSGILAPHHPEEAPLEELFWEDPLTASESLLFVLKGLVGRLSARLEGRGQAARELLLTVHYDRSIAALSTPEGQAPSHSRSLTFKLATPLFHADDLERVMRLRLQRQELRAPAVGLSLRASAITEAHPSQMTLSETAAWSCGISTDARALTVLLAELSADIGAESVGRLITQDSHLPEKSCALRVISTAELEARPQAEKSTCAATSEPELESGSQSSELQHLLDLTGTFSEGRSGLCLPQLPTRLLHPAIEIHAPIRKNELWIIGESAYVVHDVRFEQRLESIEWWESDRVFRDYFRVWLLQASTRAAKPLLHLARGTSRPDGPCGLDALVYRDRERGKSYLHALFD